MNSKRSLIVALLVWISMPLTAQRIYRTEFAPYDTREDALAHSHAATENHIKYMPKPIEVVGDVEVVGMKVDVPAAWGDYNVYLHLENTIKSYDVVVNGILIGSDEDGYTPADYFISPALHQGENEVALFLRRSSCAELGDGAKGNIVEQFSGSCLFAQHRLHVFDYQASITPDESGRVLNLALDVLVRNDFNFEEVVKVGYDIYAPDGKLIDYAVRDFTLAGRSIDTLQIRTNLGEHMHFLWSAARPQLYRLTLYVKRDGKPREYILFNLGAGTTTFADGRILRNGKPIAMRAMQYNARTTPARARADIYALRKQGINTLLPDSPQPSWFYDICDAAGMYVVERVNINPLQRSDDRTVGGTPSNNPQLCSEYLTRGQAAYYRTRNHPCIIAYALGGDKSGNGYNMYKLYEWFKRVELHRPILTPGAAGEWNTDIDTLQ